MVNSHVDTQPCLILCTILNKTTTLQKYLPHHCGTGSEVHCKCSNKMPPFRSAEQGFSWHRYSVSFVYLRHILIQSQVLLLHNWCTGKRGHLVYNTHTGTFGMVYKSCCVLTAEWPAWAVRLIWDLVQQVPSSPASLLLVLYAILSSNSFVMLKSCLPQRHTYMYVNIVDVLLDSYSDEDAVFDDCITYLIGGSHTTTFSTYNKMSYLLYTFYNYSSNLLFSRALPSLIGQRTEISSG